MGVEGKRDCEDQLTPAKAKKPRVDRGRQAAAEAATMTKEQWQAFQTDAHKSAWPKPEYMHRPREASALLIRDGGEGHYRDQTFQIVTRWMAETRIALRPHAKAPGSKSHVRYETYSQAKTVGEMLALGCYPYDWCHDYEHGFIKVEGPVREEPVDPSRVTSDTVLTDVDTCVMNWIRKEVAKKYSLNVQDLAVERGGDETIIMRAHRLVANRDAERTLAAAAREGRPVTDDEVARIMSQWAYAKNANRQNVMPAGHQWVWSDTVGLLRDRLGHIHVTHNARRYPAYCQLFNKWMADRLPEEVKDFKYTSLNLNCNYAAKRHRDGNNFGPSMIKAFGDFSGGALDVFPEDDRGIKDLSKLPESDRRSLNIKENLAMFNGNSAHEVQEMEGTRLSVVYFTLSCHDRATDEDVEYLRKVGFPFPAMDEDPHKYLRAPAGYGKLQKPGARGGGTTLMTWKCSDLERAARVTPVAPLEPVASKLTLRRCFAGKPKRGTNASR